jgi:hypothetical protein
MPWFRKENSLINWELGTLEWRTLKENPSSRKPLSKPNFWIEEEEEEPYLETRNPFPPDHLPEDVIHQIWIQAKVTHSQAFTQQSDPSKEKRSLEEMIPPEYHKFLDLFDKKAVSRFPESREWDHKIELKEGFVPRRAKMFPISQKEQKGLDDFLNENTAKGYIRPSKSSQSSGFFFVSKKDGESRPCQDSQSLR